MKYRFDLYKYNIDYGKHDFVKSCDDINEAFKWCNPMAGKSWRLIKIFDDENDSKEDNTVI